MLACQCSHFPRSSSFCCCCFVITENCFYKSNLQRVITSFKPERAKPVAIPGQVLSGGTSVWHYNRVMKNLHEIESDAKCESSNNTRTNNLSRFSPTTSTSTVTRIHHNSIVHDCDETTNPKSNQTKITLDYPLCSSLLNEHLFHADFYSGLGPYTINTEWLV